MKQVRTYQTEDGKLFSDIDKAENHELMLFVRGTLQRGFEKPQRGTVTHTSAAEVITENWENIYEYLKKLKGRRGSRKAHRKSII